MKPMLTTYLDYKHASLETQLELFQKLNLSHMIIRRIDGKRFYEIDEATLDQYTTVLKQTKIIAVDPLLEAFSMDHMPELVAYNNMLDLIAGRVKKMDAAYFIYSIPKFDESIKNYKEVVETVREQIKIIRKHKLKIFMKFSDNHTPKIYRYILDEINNKYVEVIFDYTYLYHIKEAEITGYRILRDYIGMLVMEDIDKLGSGRVIGSGENIPVSEIAKRFIKRAFDGFIILDSSLVDQLDHANNQGWFSKLVSKKTKHEIKIHNDFMERYKSVDTFRVLSVQMAILSLMFLNKKVALG